MTDNTRNEFAWAALHVLYQAEAGGKAVVRQDVVRQRLDTGRIKRGITR